MIREPRKSSPQRHDDPDAPHRQTGEDRAVDLPDPEDRPQSLPLTIPPSLPFLPVARPCSPPPSTFPHALPFRLLTRVRLLPSLESRGGVTLRLREVIALIHATSRFGSRRRERDRTEEVGHSKRAPGIATGEPPFRRRSARVPLRARRYRRSRRGSPTERPGRFECRRPPLAFPHGQRALPRDRRSARARAPDGRRPRRGLRPVRGSAGAPAGQPAHPPCEGQGAARSPGGVRGRPSATRPRRPRTRRGCRARAPRRPSRRTARA